MYSGVLRKMLTENLNPIGYYLKLEQGYINLNQCLNKKLSIKWINSICLNCNNEKDIFRQGFCKSCFFESPKTSDWIMRPEMSKAHLDIEERDLNYEKKVQLQPHVLYLAFTSDIKVGVTRKSQVPTRWIDQGATSAIEIVEVPNRYLAGISEVKLKDHYKDKTNWRQMLKNNSSEIDLESEKLKCINHLPDEVKKYINTNNKPTEILYPVNKYPENPKSLNIVKTDKFSGKLVGVKGQYLIFDNDTVFNIRSNEGIVVNITVD